MKIEYFIRMVKRGKHSLWIWEIVTYNGHVIQRSSPYENKSQCRNVGKKFASYIGLEWRESIKTK